ncbi:MAG: COG4315 family predicted lipoprotein [Acidimicrobiales bacterium]|jgi:predicted lipoprotein with Yx(FWY)xxD motif
MRTSAEIAAGPGPARAGSGGLTRRQGALGRLAAGAGASLLALSVLGAAGGTAFAAQKHAKVVHAKDQVVVDMASVSKYGKVLVDQNGLALYVDTANKPPKDWPCKGACLTVWPPLLLSKGQSKPVAGKGVTGLGVVKGPSGEQVTWHGKPLYSFVRDSKGKVLGEGIVQDGTWKVAQIAAIASGTAKTKTSTAKTKTSTAKTKTSTTKPASHWA